MQIDSLPSLRGIEIDINSLEKFSVRNLKSLKMLTLAFKEEINESLMSTRIFEDVSYIEELNIHGTFSNLNLNILDNLNCLTLSGQINSKDFNLSLSNNLQELMIGLSNIGNEQITKLFDGQIFPNLKSLKISLKIYSNLITKLEKKMFEGFPMLKIFSISDNEELRIIDYDAFSSLTNLVDLQLIGNSIEKIDHRTFSALTKLETLDLNRNQIECIEENTFSNLKNLTKLNLGNNLLSTLKPKSFYGLRNLKQLNLYHNKLSDFDLRIMDNFEKIEIIDLYSNHIQKDNIEIVKHIIEKNHSRFNNPQLN